MKVSFVVPSLSSSRARRRFERLEETLTRWFEEHREWLWMPVVAALIIWGMAVLLDYLPLPQVWSR